MLGTSRTEAQLQNASNYNNWSTDDWNFGNENQFPSIRSTEGDRPLLCGQKAPQVPTPPDPDRCPSE